MSLELKRQVRPSRAETAGKQHIVEEVRAAGFKADGALALADHIMAGVVRLDRRRRFHTHGDVTLNLLLTEIEVTACEQVQGIQAKLYDRWEL